MTVGGVLRTAVDKFRPGEEIPAQVLQDEGLVRFDRARRLYGVWVWSAAGAKLKRDILAGRA